MEKLRSEIRAAFEKEQAAHPPTAALRRNVVEAVTGNRRPARNFQWVAIAAALILGILVVVGLLSTRLARHATVPANPHASPVADYGPPPTGVPLLYVHDSNNPAWLIGYDWAATPRGTVKLKQPLPAIQMAPDGQSFLSAPAAKGGSPQFFDRLGQSISSPGAERNAGGMWADDNRHFCSVAFDQAAFTWTLVTQLPGEGPRQVAVIARDQGIGQSGISLASCSFRNDQAISVRTSTAWPSELWVIRLSDGKVLAHRTYQASVLANVVVSRDGKYIAENTAIQMVAAPPGMLSTTIRRVADWTVVTTLPEQQSVLAFSEDDSFVLEITSPWVETAPTRLAVIDLRSGRIPWIYQGPEVLGSFLTRPDGAGFAIGLKVIGQLQDPVRDIIIVRVDTEPLIVGHYQPAW